MYNPKEYFQKGGLGMPNPYVYDSDGGLVGSWDRTNGTLEMDNGDSDMRVDCNGHVTDADGRYVGQIDSSGRLR